MGMPEVAAPLPTRHSIAMSMVIAHLFNDWGFYFAHRAFHHPWLYARFHKQHHTFQGTTGIAAEFASPVESILANQGPTMGGMLLFGRHPVLVIVWLLLRLQQTYEA